MSDEATLVTATPTPAAPGAPLPSPPAPAPAPAPPAAPAPPPGSVGGAAADPAASVTERGWDGWPTTPTPEYLIPRMGKLPVSSTAHFQTVAMTGLGDTLSPERMWSRLRERLLDVAQQRADRTAARLAVTRASYGDLGTEGVVDVTARMQDAAHAGKLSFIVGPHAIGLDPAPGIRKSLSIEYLVGEAAAAVIVADGELLDVGIGAGHIDATSLYRKYLQPAPASVAEVADRMTADGLVPTDFDPDAIYSSMADVVDSLLGFAPDERLDPLRFDDPSGMDSPAEGVILYQEQGWYARGLALGNLLHSVALAPGEVTQVAMTHWNHVTRATDSEQVSQSDRSAESDTQDRSVTEIQDSALQEHLSGGSSAASTGVSTALGISSVTAKAQLGWGSVTGTMSGTSQSIGTSHNVSTAVTRSDGHKNLSMEANQHVNATTGRHAEAARTRRATVVREVSQGEDEQLTTRVLANYNHMHALTVMYFEVVEVYSLRTRVVDAERVVFLPYVVHDVQQLIPRYRAVLIDAANAAGRPDLAEAIRHHEDDLTRLDALKARIAELEDAPVPAKGGAADLPTGSIATAAAELASLRKALDDLPDRYTASRATLDGKLDGLAAQRVEATARLTEFNAMTDAARGVGVASVQVQLKALDAQTRQARIEREALASAEARERARLRSDAAKAEQRLDALRAELQRLMAAKRVLEQSMQPGSHGLFHDDRLFFNQAVWLKLPPSDVLGLARRRKTFKGEMLCERIDPAPVAISGNHVAYRWRFDDPIKSQAFKQQHVDPYVDDPDHQLSTVQADIAVPTGGVFGEAVLGRGVSAEKIDLSRFWNWKDSMIPILPTSINPLNAVTPTPQNLSAEPGRLDESSARLGPLQDLPAPSGLGALAQTMQAQIFRDMSAQGMLQSLAEATTKAAASSEQGAAQLASQNLKAGLDFMSDMAAKALSVAAAPETGGGSLLGTMVAGKGGGGGGGASLLGGVLNAHGAGGNGDLLSKLTGGNGGLTEGVEKAVEGAAEKEPGGGKNASGAGNQGGTAPPNPHIAERNSRTSSLPPTPKP